MQLLNIQAVAVAAVQQVHPDGILSVVAIGKALNGGNIDVFLAAVRGGAQFIGKALFGQHLLQQLLDSGVLGHGIGTGRDPLLEILGRPVVDAALLAMLAVAIQCKGNGDLIQLGDCHRLEGQENISALAGGAQIIGARLIGKRNRGVAVRIGDCAVNCGQRAIGHVHPAQLGIRHREGHGIPIAVISGAIQLHGKLRSSRTGELLAVSCRKPGQHIRITGLIRIEIEGQPVSIGHGGLIDQRGRCHIIHRKAERTAVHAESSGHPAAFIDRKIGGTGIRGKIAAEYGLVGGNQHIQRGHAIGHAVGIAIRFSQICRNLRADLRRSHKSARPLNSIGHSCAADTLPLLGHCGSGEQAQRHEEGHQQGQNTCSNFFLHRLVPFSVSCPGKVQRQKEPPPANLLIPFCRRRFPAKA